MGALPFVLVNLEPILTYTLEGSLDTLINNIKLLSLGIQISQKGLLVGFHLPCQIKDDPIELPAGNPILLKKSTLQFITISMFNEALPEIDTLNLIHKPGCSIQGRIYVCIFNLAADCCLHVVIRPSLPDPVWIAAPFSPCSWHNAYRTVAHRTM